MINSDLPHGTTGIFNGRFDCYTVLDYFGYVEGSQNHGRGHPEWWISEVHTLYGVRSSIQILKRFNYLDNSWVDRNNTSVRSLLDESYPMNYLLPNPKINSMGFVSGSLPSVGKNREGLYTSGSRNKAGSWVKLQTLGKIIEPLGIKYPSCTSSLMTWWGTPIFEKRLARNL